jgi:nicotinamidase-related amidase
MIPASGVLRRDSAVLVIVDVQERLAAAMERRDKVVSRCGLLARTAGIVGVPIIVTRQYPKGLGETEGPLLDAIETARADGAPVHGVDKVSFDCFAEEAFCDAVTGTGRGQLVIAGMETHICITQTALAGIAEGYDVHVAADACCSREQENHDYALARLGHAGVVITTCESAAYELVGRAGTDEFRALLQVVKG